MLSHVGEGEAEVVRGEVVAAMAAGVLKVVYHSLLDHGLPRQLDERLLRHLWVDLLMSSREQQTKQGAGGLR